MARPAVKLPPPPDLAIRARAGQEEVFDPVRRRWVVLTPEEWVRQHVIYLLQETVGVPKGLLSVERAVVGRDGRPTATPGRTDVVAHDRSGAAWMIVECKAPSVRLGPTAMEQIGRYARSIRAPYLVVTNGLTLHAWKSGREPAVLHSLPTFPD